MRNPSGLHEGSIDSQMMNAEFPGQFHHRFSRIKPVNNGVNGFDPGISFPSKEEEVPVKGQSHGSLAVVIKNVLQNECRGAGRGGCTRLRVLGVDDHAVSRGVDVTIAGRRTIGGVGSGRPLGNIGGVDELIIVRRSPEDKHIGRPRVEGGRDLDTAIGDHCANRKNANLNGIRTRNARGFVFNIAADVMDRLKRKRAALFGGKSH